MRNLIVVGFEGTHRASEVLGELQDLRGIGCSSSTTPDEFVQQVGGLIYPTRDLPLYGPCPSLQFRPTMNTLGAVGRCSTSANPSRMSAPAALVLLIPGRAV
jgi:hypothetical protein